MEMEKDELQEKKEQVLTEVKSFVKAEYELARLRVVDRASHVVATLLLTICVILISFTVLSFCAAAAVFALAQYLPAWGACLIVGGFYLLLIPLLIGCSKVLFVNPLVKKLSGLKNTEELKYATLRAEGRAAVHRERMNGHVRLAKTLYRYYVQLAQTAWNAIRRIFKK